MIFTPDPTDDYFTRTLRMGPPPLQFSKLERRHRVARCEVAPSFIGAHLVGHREGSVQANSGYVAVGSVGAGSRLWPLRGWPKQKP